MASGVDDEVEKGTSQLLPTTSYYHGFGGVDNPMLSRCAPSPAMHLEQKLTHINGFVRHLGHLDPAQEEQVVDVFSHSLQFLEGDVKGLLHLVRGRLLLPLQHLKMTANDGEWSPQFMRGKRIDLLPLVETVLKPGHHIVKNLRQLPDLISGSTILDAVAEVPLRDARGRQPDPRYRRQRAPDDAIGQ